MTLARILIIRRDNIGDLVCTTPLIHALRTRFPQARLDVLVNSYNAPVLAEHPDIDHLYIYTKAKHRQGGESALSVYWRRVKLLLTLRSVHYDVVVLAKSDSISHSVRWARQLGAKRIVGFCEQGNPLSKCINDPVALPAASSARHEVELIMQLMQPFGGITTIPDVMLQAQMAAVDQAKLQLKAAGLTVDRPLVGLHISARKPSQQWPAQRFIELAHTLTTRHPELQLALFWSPGSADNPFHPGDDEKAAEIIAACQGLPLLAMPSQHLQQLMGGLSLVDRLICSDGGAMHIAAGLGKPIVCLFGDSDAQQWHPWGVPYQLLQPASRHVQDISVVEVVSAYEKLSQNLPARSAD